MDKRELLEQRSQHRRQVRRKRALRNRAILVAVIILFLAGLFLIINSFIKANQGGGQENSQSIKTDSNGKELIGHLEEDKGQDQTLEDENLEANTPESQDDSLSQDNQKQESGSKDEKNPGLTKPAWSKELEAYDQYKSSSILVFNPKESQEVVGLNPDMKILPGSLSKLFLVEYTLDNFEMDDVVKGRNAALYMQDEESPVVYFTSGEYRVEDVIKGLILKVGDDAAYMILDNIGAKIDSQADTSKKRIEVAMKGFNDFLVEKGYKDTNIISINTTDTESTSSARDIAKVLSGLLDNKDVTKYLSTHILEVTNGNGDRLTMVNRNSMINPSDQIHRENILGGIYGSSLNVNNLASVYEKNDQRYIIITLDSEKRGDLYDDTVHIVDFLDKEIN